MNELNTFDALIPHSEPVDAIFTQGSANIFVRLGLPSSTKCLCSSRRKLSPS
jgi:hypothetical protein